MVINLGTSNFTVRLCYIVCERGRLSLRVYFNNNNNNNNINNKWKNKVIHGQYIRNIDRELIGEEDNFLWLKAETESELVAAQDQALQTKCYATKILNTEMDSKWRLC